MERSKHLHVLEAMVEEWIGVWLAGWLAGQIDRMVGGWMDGQTDRWMDGQTEEVSLSPLHSNSHNKPLKFFLVVIHVGTLG